MADLTNIIPISEANLETLKNGGTVSGQTYDENALYLPTTTSADLIADGVSKKFVTNVTDNGDGTISLTIGDQTITFTGTIS